MAPGLTKNQLTARWVLVTFAMAYLLIFIVQGGIIDRNYNYTTILNTIAEGESNRNYNAYYSNGGNTDIDFTSMKVGEVIAWQKEFVDKGSPSSAVGKYQFIRSTLEGLVKEHKIDRNQTFSPSLQDELAIALLERRGVHDYMDGKIDREDFAHNLSKEWAALPKAKGDKPESSYYAGDGLNKVRVTLDEINSGIESLHDTPE
ncbi:hypothetical protein BH23PAT2_BH23PAT2_08130 [soil metagenome]